MLEGHVTKKKPEVHVKKSQRIQSNTTGVYLCRSPARRAVHAAWVAIATQSWDLTQTHILFSYFFESNGLNVT